MLRRGHHRQLIACLLSGGLAACAAGPGVLVPKLAVPIGKPTAPVEISFEASGAAVPGQPALVNVFVTPFGALDLLEVDFGATDGAVLLDPAPPAVIEVPQAGEIRTWSLTVAPPAAGKGYLRVIASTWLDGAKRTRVAVFPVQGAAPAAKSAPGRVTQTPEGERIRSMPARESGAPSEGG